MSYYDEDHLQTPGLLQSIVNTFKEGIVGVFQVVFRAFFSALYLAMFFGCLALFGFLFYVGAQYMKTGKLEFNLRKWVEQEQLLPDQANEPKKEEPKKEEPKPDSERPKGKKP